MKDYKIVDLHCDTLCSLLDQNLDLDNDKTMINLNTLIEGNVDLQVFACFAIYVKNPYLRVTNLIAEYEKMHKAHKELIKVLNASDLDKVGLKTMLSIEEGGALEGKMEKLYEFYNKGVRLITLTWNFKNEIASPNDVRENKPNETEGLTEFGHQLIEEMNKLGMVVDISHLGDKGALEVLKTARKPVFASHSCARKICGHVRNMTDEMLKLLIENNGIIGINFCHDFITKSDSIATVKEVCDHIDYIKSLGGMDNIAFGSDFDGISNENIEMKNPSYFKNIINELISRNYSSEEIEKICSLNVKRALKEILK